MSMASEIPFERLIARTRERIAHDTDLLADLERRSEFTIARTTVERIGEAASATAASDNISEPVSAGGEMPSGQQG